MSREHVFLLKTEQKEEEDGEEGGEHGDLEPCQQASPGSPETKTL